MIYNPFQHKKFVKINNIPMICNPFQHKQLVKIISQLSTNIGSNIQWYDFGNDTLLTKCDITNCQAEEAGQKSIRHVINCVKNHYSTVAVSTTDTDVLLLLLSVLPLVKQIPLLYTPNIYCRFVIGDGLRFHNINELCLLFGEETCKSLPFVSRFHRMWHSVVIFQSQ